MWACMLTHPAEAGPLAGDKGPRHRVAARAVSIVQPAVRDVQGATLQLCRLHVNKANISVLYYNDRTAVYAVTYAAIACFAVLGSYTYSLFQAYAEAAASKTIPLEW